MTGSSEQPRLSIVVPCFNAAGTIGGMLEALAAQDWSQPWEVIVADNGSTDDSVRVAESFRQRLPGLQVVDASGKRGASHARNIGSRAASGRSIVFCDADDVVATGWLAAIGDALEKHSFVASRHEFEALNEAGHLRGRQPTQVSELQHLWYPPYLDHAGACGLGIRSGLFEAHGGFSEDYVALQDTEYCLRLELAGTPLQFVPDAVIHIRFRERNQPVFHQANLWAYYNVLLCKRYRRPGEPVPGGWRSWFREARRLVLTVGRFIRSPERRAGLAWQYGWQLGLLRGALRWRIPPVALDNNQWSSLIARATDYTKKRSEKSNEGGHTRWWIRHATQRRNGGAAQTDGGDW